jgi:hypothetical protein
MKVEPGQAKAVADKLHKKMLLYIKHFERPRNE